MKERMKKILGVGMMVSVLSVSLILSGCGSSEASSTETTDTETSDASSETETVKIGDIYDMSGDTAAASSMIPAALEMAIEDLNSNGGVLGKQVELVSMDGAGDVQTYADAANQLAYESGVVATFSQGTSASREAIRPIFEEAEMLYFYSSMYEGGVASDYNYATGVSPEQNTLPLLEYIKDNNLGSKIYLLAADYNFGQICGQWLEKYADELGFEVVGTEYIPLDVNQFGSTITNILDSGADIIWYDMVGSNQMSFYEQWYNATNGTDYEDILFTGGTLLLSGEQDSIDPKYLAGQLAAGAYFPGVIEEAADFEARFAEISPNVSMNDQTVSAYYSIMLWAAACERAGSFDTAAVKDALNSEPTTVDNGIGGTVTLDNTQHHVAMDMYLVNIGDGLELDLIDKFENVEPTYIKSLGLDLSQGAPNKQFSPLDEE